MALLRILAKCSLAVAVSAILDLRESSSLSCVTRMSRRDLELSAKMMSINRKQHDFWDKHDFWDNHRLPLKNSWHW